ncbi:MAG: Rrf2 family transcriptional regulator [Synechococcales bacterium]|nr:Rrf2 family transcriptional regulator [Synechococcales bacterium]
MELSTKSEYALLALLELAAHHHTKEPVQIRQIATEQDIPDRYLEQLLASLRRSGLVRSQRGAKGGYLLTREPWKISLLEIIACIEGLDANSTVSKQQHSSPEGIVIHEVWQEACGAAEGILQKYTLQDLLEKRNARQQPDIMYYI